jgi:hypothetical protein
MRTNGSSGSSRRLLAAVEVGQPINDPSMRCEVVEADASFADRDYPFIRVLLPLRVGERRISAGSVLWMLSVAQQLPLPELVGARREMRVHRFVADLRIHEKIDVPCSESMRQWVINRMQHEVLVVTSCSIDQSRLIAKDLAPPGFARAESAPVGVDDSPWFDETTMERLLEKAHGPGARSIARLRKIGRVLGVWNPVERVYQYPRCQLQDGALIPQVRDLLRLLPGDVHGARQAEWLLAPHPLLDGRSPSMVLPVDPDSVLRAAAVEFLPSKPAKAAVGRFGRPLQVADG